jgi:hypothetical protein
MEYVIEFLGYFLFIAGFVVGLGAVIVIDILGFLGRKSEYWTEATIRTHKVTKPLIWVGTCLAVVGGIIFYTQYGFTNIASALAVIAVVLVLNGLFLSFVVSPFLLAQEKMGNQRMLLPASFQKKIAASLIVSDVGWWSALILFVMEILK